MKHLFTVSTNPGHRTLGSAPASFADVCVHCGAVASEIADLDEACPVLE